MRADLIQLFADGIRYVRDHPQFLLTLLLIVIIPVAFFVNATQFLAVSEENQFRLERDRIGLLHDSFLSVVRVSNADPVILQHEINELSALNPDLVAFRVSRKTSEGFVPIAALDTEVIGKVEQNDAVYNLAFANPNESIVQIVHFDDGRYLRGVRLAETESDDLVIFTLTSRASVDALFASRKQVAFIWLAVILVVVLTLVMRHVKLIDYAYLYRETKKANEMKDLFTNMIAHELRAPLTAMRGYASMIREKESLDLETKEQATRIEQSAGRLVVIVNDLLDVARIQSGKLSVARESVNISDVIHAVIDELESSAKEKGIELHTEGVLHPVMITGDAKRLHQALTNLVSNAIKYTKQGSITLSLEDRRDRVELRVKDTGMGIAADDQKGLFAPFYRVQTDDVSQITGTGLGMWITKQLIELMYASIAVESIKGVGTHVVVTFPKKSS